MAGLGLLQLVLMAWALFATRASLRERRRADQAVRDRAEAMARNDAVFWRLCAEARRNGRDYRVDARAQAAHRLHMDHHYSQRLN